jgi:hypothetical protein
VWVLVALVGFTVVCSEHERFGCVRQGNRTCEAHSGSPFCVRDNNKPGNRVFHY